MSSHHLIESLIDMHPYHSHILHMLCILLGVEVDHWEH